MKLKKAFSGRTKIVAKTKTIKAWLPALVVSAGLFLLVRPTFAQIVGRETDVASFLASGGSVSVGVETKNGYQQVYYLFNGSKTFVTEGNQNSRQPDARGEYVSWVTDFEGAGQIMLYRIPSKTLVQITHSSTNLQPKVDRNGKVVWEGWVTDRWQIFLFDGKSARQLTDGDTSVKPQIENDFVVFARQDEAGEWKATAYSLALNKLTDINFGLETKTPKIKERKIFLGEKEFPLRVDELFLLNLEPLATPEPTGPPTVTEEEVKEELSTSALF